MRFQVIDIETTGFNRSFDEIVSFAYLTFSSDLKTILDKGVLYFYREGMRWSKEAEAVHKISQEFLREHKDQYSDNLKTMFKKVQRSNMVGFNNDSFDNSFISNYLDRHMYGEQNYTSSIDIMKVFRPKYGRMKLQVLTEQLGASHFILNNLSQLWFGLPFEWHKAHADVVATAFCLLEAKRRKLI